MFFRQLFEQNTSTYTYLLADEKTKEAVIIDPVKEKIEQYILLINELGFELKFAMDTHVHADHITALGDLSSKSKCTSVMGEFASSDCVNQKVKHGDVLTFGVYSLEVIHTPGHTNDSLSFYVKADDAGYLFSGDTLLVRGTGRTDFQNGSAEQLYDSITGKLFTLPAQTMVYPGHDYQGRTASTIGEEMKFNPRLAGKSKTEFVEIMNNLNLPDPKLIDIAVPANQACGRAHH